MPWDTVRKEREKKQQQEKQQQKQQQLQQQASDNNSTHTTLSDNNNDSANNNAPVTTPKIQRIFNNIEECTAEQQMEVEALKAFYVEDFTGFFLSSLSPSLS